MLKKTLIAIAAAGTLALGLGGATTPAEARHKSGHITLCIGDCFYGDRYGYRYRYNKFYHCHYKKVKVWNKRHTKKIWVTKKTYCHSARHY
jgi:hypothetical protein